MKASPCAFTQNQAFYRLQAPLKLNRISCRGRRFPICRADPVKERSPSNAEPSTESSVEEADVERITKKWGLEAGLFKAMTSKKEGDKSAGETAKELLKKYGSAYLITSISFAIVSFVLCYFLIDIGVDVSALLAKIGINVSDTGEKVGTVAIAYAAHKAASPIRFPPTVALTPVVANWLGRKQDDQELEGDNTQDASDVN